MRINLMTMLFLVVLAGLLAGLGSVLLRIPRNQVFERPVAMDVSETGHRVAVQSESGTVYVYDLRGKGRLIRQKKFRGPDGYGRMYHAPEVRFADDRELVINNMWRPDDNQNGALASSLKSWNLGNNQVLEHDVLQGKGLIRPFHCNGNLIAVIPDPPTQTSKFQMQTTIEVYELHSRDRVCRILHRSKSGPGLLQFSEDETLLFALYGNDSAAYRLPDGDERSDIDLAYLNFRGDLLSANGRYFYRFRDGANQPIVEVVESKNDRVVTELSPAGLQRWHFGSFSPDEKLFSIHLDDSIEIYRIPESKSFATLPIDKGSLFEISHDGKQLIVFSAGPNRGLEIWDIESQTFLGRVGAGQGTASWIALYSSSLAAWLICFAIYQVRKRRNTNAVVS